MTEVERSFLGFISVINNDINIASHNFVLIINLLYKAILKFLVINEKKPNMNSVF